MASSAAMLPGLPSGGAPSGGDASGAEGFTPTGTDADFDAIFGSDGAPSGEPANGDDGREPALEEMLVDKATLSPEELEMAGLAEEGTAPPAKKPDASPAKPAPDANQQFQLMLVQQFQQMQQQNLEFQKQMMESLRPKQQETTPSKFDIASVLPENLRGIDGVPQLAQAIYSQVEKQFAERDQAAQTTQQKQAHQAAVNQWVAEARHVQAEVLKDGYKFANPQDAHQFGSMIRDLAISMADAQEGTTPAQFLTPIKQLIKAGVQAQIAALNEKTKAGMPKRVPNAPLQQVQRIAKGQAPGDAAFSVPDMNSRPTPEELRAVRMSASVSAMEGDHSVRQLRAQRAREAARKGQR